MNSLGQKGSQPDGTLPECSVIYGDANNCILSWDSNAEELFGWTVDEAQGKNLFLLLFPWKHDVEMLSLRELFSENDGNVFSTKQFEDEVQHRDGWKIPVEIIISPLPDSQHYSLFIRNIGETVAPVPDESSRSYGLEVINTILKISLEPALLKDRLKAVLAYLTSLHSLNLSSQAALFLVEQETKTLILSTQYGFSNNPIPCCENVPFGHCYCGKAAEKNKLQYIGVNGSKHSISHGHYCVPLSIDDTVIGVMSFYTPEIHTRSRLTEETLSLAAPIIAALINNQKMDLQLINLVNDLRTSVLALHEEKNFSESIIQGLQHGLIITDQNGTILKCNGAAESIFNCFTEKLEGKNLTDVVGPKNKERIFNLNTTSSPPEEAELSIALVGGNELLVRYSAISRPDNANGAIGRIISLTDVSEWRHVRKEMEKMNRLSTVAEIASAVAHEVRNPLAGIKIMAQSIEEGSGSEEERLECSQRIIRQVDRLNELLTDFFSYARPVIPKKRVTSLEHILSETKPLIINKLVEQRIKLIENFQENLPPVIADPNQLQQVFLNLFLNAIDAIRQEGFIEISACSSNGRDISTYRKKNHFLDPKIRYVIVHFKDNGAGMSRIAAEQVFEPFYTTKSNGSGLGMSIVYRTLKENDADISVESTEGQGTQFTMFFKSD